MNLHRVAACLFALGIGPCGQSGENSGVVQLLMCVTTTDWPVVLTNTGCHVPHRVPAETGG
jgi:hypothetical protein